MDNGLKPLNIRKENIKRIIKLFRTTGELYSRADISRKLSLSAPSVSEIISIFLDNNILYESKEGKSSVSGGRRPILLDLNRECGFIIGVHIETKTINIVLANISGEIKANSIISYDTEDNFNPVECLINNIKSVLKNNNISEKKVLTLGITLPGVFDPKLNTIKLAPNIRKWENISIKDRLEETFVCKVIIENAVNTAVLGEKWQGKITGKSNAIYVKIDKGIGAGILINGRLYKGYAGLAGEIGFMIADKNEIPGDIGLKGSLEKHCSTEAIIKKAGEYLKEEDLSLREIVHLAENGNKELYKLLYESSRLIALSIANIVCVINPEVVVIGGEFIEAAQMFYPEIEDIIKKVVPIAPQIVCSELGKTVFYLGIIYQSFNGIEEQVIDRYFI